MRYALLLVPLTGCGTIETLEPADVVLPYSWRWDASCLQPTSPQVASMTVAADLWDHWGVEWRENQRADIDVCITPGQPRPGFDGWTSSDRIELAAYVSSALVVAHEFGHVVLSQPQHLDEGMVGVMASTVAQQPDVIAWSDADADLLAAHGLVDLR